MQIITNKRGHQINYGCLDLIKEKDYRPLLQHIDNNY